VGNYVVKYLNKALMSKEYVDIGDIYLCSQGLKVPRVYRDDEKKESGKDELFKGMVWIGLIHYFSMSMSLNGKERLL